MLVIKRIILLALVGISGILSGLRLYYNNLPVKQEIEDCYNITCPVVESLYNNSYGCAEAILWNNSNLTLKSFYVEIHTEKDLLVFETTMLPPDSRVLLQERSKTTASDLNIRDIIVHSDAAMVSEGFVSVQVNLNSPDPLQ